MAGSYPTEAGGQKSQSILIVEDDPGVTGFLEEMLQAAGFRVLVAPDGESAVETLKAEGSSVACIILDYETPGMHAIRALTCFRQINPDVKIILSSGYSEEDISPNVTASKIDGFIAKPYDLRAFLSQMAEILSAK